MKKLTWTLQILLTLVMGLFGLQKVLGSIPDLIAQGMWWIEDFATWQVRAIGLLETLGAMGLLAPVFLRRLPPVLVPLAASGLAVTMLGAIATHVRRGDPAASIVLTTVLFAMAAFVARERFRSLRPDLALEAVAPT